MQYGYLLHVTLALGRIDCVTSQRNVCVPVMQGARTTVLFWSAFRFSQFSLSNAVFINTVRIRSPHFIPGSQSAVHVLYWPLPVTFRVEFKLLLFVYKSLHNRSPPSVKDLLSLKPTANNALHSSSLTPFAHTRCHQLELVAVFPFLKSNLKHFF